MKHFLILILLAFSVCSHSQTEVREDFFINSMNGLKNKTPLSSEMKKMFFSENSLNVSAGKDYKYSLQEDRSLPGYKFIATLNTGTIPNSNQFGSYSPNFILNARFSYFFSEMINIGLDVSYTPFKEESYEYAYDPDDKAKETFTDLIINSQYGTFDRNNVVDFYLNVGTGMHIFYRSSYKEEHYSINDTLLYSYYNKSYIRLYPLLQIGAGLIIKPSYNIGINLEADMQAYGFGFIFFPAEANFPLKAGISYFFMK